MCDSRVMRIPACIWLCPEDRVRLERLIADRNTPRKVVWRSRIVLLSAAGCGTMEIMRRTRDIKADGVALAGALPGGRGRWPVARQEPAAGDAAAERRHQDASADQDDARDAAGRDPLERALDGARGRHQPHQRPEYLARARPQAASGGQLQGLQRPGVRGESRGRGRPLPRSAGQGGGLFGRREEPKSRHSTAANRACP